MISSLKKKKILTEKIKTFKKYTDDDFFSKCSNNFIILSLVCQHATKFVVRVLYASAMLHHLVNVCSFCEKFNNKGYLFLHPEWNEMNKDGKVAFLDTPLYVLTENYLTTSNKLSLFDNMFKGMIPLADDNCHKDM